MKVLALIILVLSLAIIFAFAQVRQRTLGSKAQPAEVSQDASGNLIVGRGDDLQKALQRARPGQTIVLEAGATFKGPIMLPRKEGNAYITIQSSRVSQLPGPGLRVSPKDAAFMPKIVSPGKAEKALTTEEGAHHYRFIGVEFAPIDEQADVRNIIWLGENETQTDLAKVPHHLEFDRCYIHGYPNSQQIRAVALNSAATDIINSYISEIHYAGADSQAICGWSGPGPFKIINNYLEAAGENIMFGGSDNFIRGLVPRDIEIRHNNFNKPLAWRERWTVKNLLELKNAEHVVIEGNLFENNWGGDQPGFAIVFSPRNQEGRSPWSAVRDILFTNNIVRHSGSALSVLGRDNNYPSERTERIRVINNLFEDIDGAKWRGNGVALMQTGEGAKDLVIDHNTFIHTGNGIVREGPGKLESFVLTNNIFRAPIGCGNSAGAQCVAEAMPGAVIKGNVILGTTTNIPYPPGNFYPTYEQGFEVLGFVNPTNGDLRLKPTSPYRSKATDKKDVGADLDQIHAALAAAPTSESK